MNLAMVPAAERHRKLITDLTSESARLDKTQVVCIAGHPTAHQAGLASYIPDMLAIPNATRLRDNQCGFIDGFCSPLALWRGRTRLPQSLGRMNLSRCRRILRQRCEASEPGLERVFDT